MRSTRMAVGFGCAAAAAVVIAAAVVMTAPYGQHGGPAADDLRQLRVGYFPVVGHAIPIIGMETGAFSKNLPGVQIHPHVFDSGPQVVESMFAGSIDIAYVGPGPAINAFLNSADGKRIRVLATAASGGTSFVAHPDAVSGDGSFDFAHKRIAAPQIGNTQDVSLRHHLTQQGLQSADRGGNVIIFNIPNPDIVTLFVKGEIDGAWVSEPWATILADELGGVRVFHEEDLWPGGMFATVLLIADMSYAGENPDVIRAWIRSHEDVARVINSDRDAAGVAFNDFLLGHFGRGLDGATVQTAMRNTEVTSSPLRGTVYEFAQRADALGYMGRGGEPDLSGLYYDAALPDAGGAGTGSEDFIMVDAAGAGTQDAAAYGHGGSAPCGYDNMGGASICVGAYWDGVSGSWPS